jgi:hypothetical protein
MTVCASAEGKNPGEIAKAVDFSTAFALLAAHQALPG